MMDGVAERPVLTDQQTLELNYIKLTWDVESASGPPYWVADRYRAARASRAC